MELAAILTAVSVLLTAVVTGVIAIIREVRRVHVIVNQQRTDMIKEIRSGKRKQNALLEEIKALKRMIRSGGGDPEDA